MRGLFHKNKKLFERHLNTCNSSVPADSFWNHMAIRIYLWLAINWMIFTNSLPIGNVWKSPKIHPSIISIHFKLFTLPETNIAPQNGRLEDQFPFGVRPIFMGELLVSGRVAETATRVACIDSLMNLPWKNLRRQRLQIPRCRSKMSSPEGLEP